VLVLDGRGVWQMQVVASLCSCCCQFVSLLLPVCVFVVASLCLCCCQFVSLLLPVCVFVVASLCLCCHQLVSLLLPVCVFVAASLFFVVASLCVCCCQFVSLLLPVCFFLVGLFLGQLLATCRVGQNRICTPYFVGLAQTVHGISIYFTVFISPRTANVFHPLAVCREQFKYLSYKGLAKLALW